MHKREIVISVHGRRETIGETYFNEWRYFSELTGLLTRKDVDQPGVDDVKNMEYVFINGS